MADQEQKSGGESAEGGTEETAAEESAKHSSESESTEESGGDAERSDGKSEDESEEDADDKKDSSGEKAEPPTRKRPVDFILERKNRKIEKLQKQSQSSESDAEADASKAVPKEAIQEAVAEALKPIVEKLTSDSDEGELRQFLAHPENEVFRRHEGTIRKYMNHPAWQQVPLEAIATFVGKDDLLKIGARKAAEAEAEARKSATGGSSARNDKAGEVDVWGMSKDEFEKKKFEVMTRRRD